MFKKVMAFIANQTVVNNKVQPNPRDNKPSIPGNELSPQELELLLGVLRDVTLKGHQVEVFYNLIVKIQNQYLQHQNK